MPTIDIRELLQFPTGDNSTDVLINGVHFNRTALDLFNYTYYSNNTISNASSCYLVFDQYQPFMQFNGSWVNGTSCYGPYYGIRQRGTLSVAFATLFGLSIMFTLVNLRKHGRMFIREDKRFRIVGRRWQWYWMCFVAACGMISTISGIDVDRDYLQDLAIILQSFFFTLMLPGTLAVVWEAVRHWGSWQERQICDRDPYLLPQDDRRGKTEFYLPLVFYLFAWLDFFMTIPRNWNPLKLQHSVMQQETVAEPSGTDVRNKIGGILAAMAWCVICYSLWHSLHHYRPRGSPGLWNRFDSFCKHCPTKLFLAIVILAIRIAYAIAAAWEWDISIYKYDVGTVWPYTLGYGSTVLLLVVFEVWGYLDENEDKVLLQQRGHRGAAADRELGIVAKPSWWSKHWGDSHLSDEQRLRNLTTEIGGGRPTMRHIESGVELKNLNGSGLRDRSRSRPVDDPFSDTAPEQPTQASAEEDRMGRTGGPRLDVARQDSEAPSVRTARTDTSGTTVGNPQPQVIRSMLDV